MMENKIDLKLLIDECSGRLVFMECDRDFVDLLLSFLVMPIGAVVRLSAKGSCVGCMDALYESVEKLDADIFQTKACKHMLLLPNYAWRSYCNDLELKVDHETQFDWYTCPASVFCSSDWNYYSTIKKVTCKCGDSMECTDLSSMRSFSDEEAARNGEVGVFIKLGKKAKYMISDDLHIAPASTERAMALLKEFGITDCGQLHKKLFPAGREEVIRLLTRALVSKTPLSDVFLGKGGIFSIPDSIFCQTRMTSNESKVGLSDEKKMSMKLFLIKSTKEVLYAEANEDVVDFLFSFLTFPLGILPNLHKDILPLGCVNQLQTSVSELSAQNQLRTAEHSSMLLQPKLAPHHRCQNQILKIEDAGLADRMNARNPRFSEFTCEEGGGFVKGPLTFMITNEFHVKIAAGFDFFDSIMRIDDVEEKVLNIGEEEGLMLLRISLTYKSPLGAFFRWMKTKESI